MLYYPDGSNFSTGLTTCTISSLENESKTIRIKIPIEIERVKTTAVIDTGGVYAIIEPSLAIAIGFDPQGAIGNDVVQIRGYNIQGNLYRAELAIDATDGQSLVQEVTVFVPDIEAEGWGNLPSMLGLMGCMEFIRFAVDPIREVFYFGSAQDHFL